MKRELMIAGSAVLLAVGAALTAVPTAANVEARSQGTPTVSVRPSTGLAGGKLVQVVATGLPPRTQVRVVQCDTFDNPDEICSDRAVVSTSKSGQLKVGIRLLDPLIAQQPFGDGRAVYCRADQCRIGIVAMPGEVDEFRALAQSTRLVFKGSPATVRVKPSTGLRARQWVKVSGTAHGAAGRTVRVTQQACYRMVQGTGCYGALAPRYARVQANGSFSLLYKAHRYLPNDGSPVDCTAGFDMLGDCVVTATVLGRDGQPDNSFGIADWGEPMASLTFLGSPGSKRHGGK